MNRPLREWLIVGAIVAGGLVLLAMVNLGPTGVSLRYLVSVLIIVQIYAVFALGLNLELGFAGLPNFGHVASMAVAGYTIAIFVPRAEAAFGLSERLAGPSLLGFLASLLAGLPFAVASTVAAFAILARLRKNRLPPPRQLAVGLGVGLIVLALVAIVLFPLSERGGRFMSVYLGMLVAIMAAGSFGFVLGLPAIRLREDYLAIVSLGAAEILRSIAVNEVWLTRGTLGIQQVERPLVEWATQTSWWLRLADGLDIPPVFLVHALAGLVALATVYAILEVLARSPWGRIVRAIRDDEDVASALGKNVHAHKLQVLVLGSAVAGLAGILLIWHLSNVYPDHFLSLLTFYAFIIVLVGGIGNHRGTIVGAFILWLVFELAGSLGRLEQLGLRNVAGPPQLIFIGLMIIVVMMFRPQGMLGRKEEMPYAK